MRMFRWALSGLIALYLLFSPRWILSGLSADPRGALFQNEPPDWYGLVELWHIASFRPYRGSVTTFLEERAVAYGKTHPGVRIKVIGITEKQFAERIARGETPDAYSFASGLIYREALSELPLEVPKLVPPAVPARAEGELYAVPYLLSGYALAVNTQLLYSRALTMPEAADSAFLQAALDYEAKSPQLYAPEILAARLKLSGALAAREDFLAGGVLAALCDVYTVGMINRSDRLNLLIEAVPAPEYTDLVQYIGPARGADEKRREVVADFAAYLLSEDVQKKLPAIGCLPALYGAPDVVYDEPLLSALFENYQTAAAPDPFAYERHKGTLLADAQRALFGEANAQSAFDERLNVVLSGIS